MHVFVKLTSNISWLSVTANYVHFNFAVYFLVRLSTTYLLTLVPDHLGHVLIWTISTVCLTTFWKVIVRELVIIPPFFWCKLPRSIACCFHCQILSLAGIIRVMFKSVFRSKLISPLLGLTCEIKIHVNFRGVFVAFSPFIMICCSLIGIPKHLFYLTAVIWLASVRDIVFRISNSTTSSIGIYGRPRNTIDTRGLICVRWFWFRAIISRAWTWTIWWWIIQQ